MKNWALLIMVVLFGCTDQQVKNAQEALRTGNAHYHAQAYAAAVEAYEQASYDPRAIHNSGKANFRASDYQQSVEDLMAAVNMVSGSTGISHAYHDLGTARVKRAQWADSMSTVLSEEIGAIRMEGDDIAGRVKLAVLRDSLRSQRSQMEQLVDSSLVQSVLDLRQALRHDPTDEDTRYNLVYSQRLLDARKKEHHQNDPNDDQQEQQLTERARALLAQADELVESYRFKEALELLQRGIQEDPSLAREKEYIDKLDVVSRAADAS